MFLFLHVTIFTVANDRNIVNHFYSFLYYTTDINIYIYMLFYIHFVSEHYHYRTLNEQIYAPRTGPGQ